MVSPVNLRMVFAADFDPVKKWISTLGTEPTGASSTPWREAVVPACLRDSPGGEQQVEAAGKDGWVGSCNSGRQPDCGYIHMSSLVPNHRNRWRLPGFVAAPRPTPDARAASRRPGRPRGHTAPSPWPSSGGARRSPRDWPAPPCSRFAQNDQVVLHLGFPAGVVEVIRPPVARSAGPALAARPQIDRILRDRRVGCALIATSFDGAPVSRDHGGPARVIIPKLYAWKGEQFVNGITFLAEDKLGFWEVRGYSNTADPWKEERYA